MERGRGSAFVVMGAASEGSGLFYMSSISSVFGGVLVFNMIYFSGIPRIDVGD